MANNRFPNNPPIMYDSRTFTDWRPRCNIEEQMKKQSGVKNEDQYRHYLEHNATNIINNEYNKIYNKTLCRNQHSLAYQGKEIKNYDPIKEQFINMVARPNLK